MKRELTTVKGIVKITIFRENNNKCNFLVFRSLSLAVVSYLQPRIRVGHFIAFAMMLFSLIWIKAAFSSNFKARQLQS